MKSTATKSAAHKQAASAGNKASRLSMGGDERLNWIATAAYYKAEASGFVPGQEVEHWLQAEAELNELKPH